MYAKAEIQIINLESQQNALLPSDERCINAIQDNINFADKIYQDALTTEKYETENKLTNSLKIEHKNYDALRTLLWTNSINLKERCNATYHIVVYLYEYEPKTVEEKAKQQVFSNYLEQLKEAKGNSIILIPIARNLGIDSLNMLQEKYEINQTIILVDEKLKISEIDSLGEIESYLN
jgi:hypothetical protein